MNDLWWNQGSHVHNFMLQFFQQRKFDQTSSFIKTTQYEKNRIASTFTLLPIIMAAAMILTLGCESISILPVSSSHLLTNHFQLHI